MTKTTIAGLIGAGLLLVACGGGSGGSGSSPAPTSPSPTASPTTGACEAIGSSGSNLLTIVNGANCSSSSGSVVLLNLRDPDAQVFAQCSGTVIAPRAILSAAHCVPGAASSRVFTGSFPEVIANAISAHPGYRGEGTSAFDVSILLTDSDIGRPALPILTSRDVRVGEAAVVSGWGKDASLLAATMRAGNTSISAVDSTVIQSQFSASSAFVCQGDSGGPLLVQEGGTWAVAGVISANTNTACNTGNNFYASLRATGVLTFITDRVPGIVRR